MTAAVRRSVTVTVTLTRDTDSDRGTVTRTVTVYSKSEPNSETIIYIESDLESPAARAHWQATSHRVLA